MLFSLSFNGIKKDYLICERGKRRSAFAPVKRNMLTVQGMPGAHLESTDTEVRIIQQPIIINGKDRFDVRKLEEDLSAWLITDKAAELIFDDEPDRVYYALIDGSLDIEDIARFGRGTFTFICPDPYKYGPEIVETFPKEETVQTDLKGKVSGSTVENPHYADSWAGASLPSAPSADRNSYGQAGYDRTALLDGLTRGTSQLSNNKYFSYHQFSFDLISLIERQYGAAIPGASTAEKVAWLKANITQLTANWHGKGTNKLANPTGTANFAGKVSGSTVENPHVAKGASANTLLIPSGGWAEQPQASYNNLVTLNGVSSVFGQTATNGNIGQQLFSFNLIEYVQRKYGVTVPGTTTADKVQWLKDNIQSIRCRWHGHGSGPSGNKASLALWNPTLGSWNAYKVTHTAGVVYSISISNLTFPLSMADTLDSNGFAHFLAYAEASDGTTASTINTDYVELEVELKAGVDKASFTFAEGSTWFGSPTIRTSDKVNLLQWNINSPGINNRIQSDGFIHFLAYAEPSNGIAPSTIETDYIELIVKLKTPHLPIKMDYLGTKEADPVIELEVLTPVTFALIQNQDNEYMMIGKPVDVESVPFTRLQTVLSDGCSSLVGWSAVPQGTVLDTGIVGGTMKVHGGYAFTADTYGTNPNGWVGPAIKKSLSAPVQDFRAEVQLAASNTGGQVGSIELHLIDENDNLIAVLAMRDATASRANNRAVVQLGSAGKRKTILDYYGDRPGTWNDFSGIIRLEREGAEFRVYVTELDAKGNHVGRHTAQPFFDTLGAYQGRIAQVLVYDAKAKSYSTYSKLLHNIYIGKINQQTGIPYIANTGDIITFDHTRKGSILLNGEPRKDLKDFGADYFKLKSGVNTLILHPGESFNTSIRYRERYL